MVMCVAHQPDANAEILGMLWAKIFQNILCRKNQGSLILMLCDRCFSSGTLSFQGETVNKVE